MKKVLLTVIGFGLALGLNAQEAAEKKVQAGLVVGAGMNFQKMGTNKLSENGIGSDLTVGANVTIGFNKTIGFVTGLEFDFSTTRFKADGSPVFYRFDDKQILRKGDESSTATGFSLSERSQKAAYITIPTMMLFRTNYMGYFRYFGKFGLRNSFLASSKTKDTGIVLDANGILTGSETTLEGMKRKNEMWFYKGAVGLAGGAEWNFSGATCLVAELGFYYGFTPLYYSPKEDKKSLASLDGTYFSNAATQSQLMLKISILF